MNINIDIYLSIILLHFVDESYRLREFKWIILGHPDSKQWKFSNLDFSFSVSVLVLLYTIITCPSVGFF